MDRLTHPDEKFAYGLAASTNGWLIMVVSCRGLWYLCQVEIAHVLSSLSYHRRAIVHAVLSGML